MNTPQEFAELYDGLQRLAARAFRGGGALATLLRTNGATFRRPGARMLVCGDGEVVRGLSGGCPEADIIARARDVIAAGRPRVLRYDRENGFDSLLELGCGGELEVLVEPLTSPVQIHFADVVHACLQRRQPGLLATWFARDGRCLTPRRLVRSRGAVLFDAFDAPELSAEVIALNDALALDATLEARRPETLLLEVAGARCEVLLESLTPPQALVVIGVNAAALALTRIVAGLGWSVSLVAHLASPAPAGLAAGVAWRPAAPPMLTQALHFDGLTSVVVMTHNLQRDIEYLRALADLPLAYLGALGSRRRARMLCEGSGLEPPRLRAPAGLDIGAETPEEIALSVAAELLAVGRRRDPRSLSVGAGPMH